MIRLFVSLIFNGLCVIYIMNYVIPQSNSFSKERLYKYLKAFFVWMAGIVFGMLYVKM